MTGISTQLHLGLNVSSACGAATLEGRKMGKKREEDTNFEPVVQGFAWRWIESCKDNIMASLFHLNNNWDLSHKDTPILKKQKPHDQFPKLKKFEILQKNLQKPLLFLLLLLPKPLPVT
jgi:hypothetical protein